MTYEEELQTILAYREEEKKRHAKMALRAEAREKAVRMRKAIEKRQEDEDRIQDEFMSTWSKCAVKSFAKKRR